MDVVKRLLSFHPRRWSALAIAVQLIVTLAPAYADSNTYIYDANGRLVGIVHKSGSTAIYNYDANGNLTSIVTPAAGNLAIAGFTPPAGAIGTTVAIFGQGFSTTLANNVVKFNGVPVAVSAATPNRLTVSVPAGATTGLISVSTAGASVNSANAFVVLNNLLPTITSVTPLVGTAGTPVTITGTQFAASSTAEHVYFRGLTDSASATVAPSSTTTKIATTVPEGATTGPVSVSTRYGTAQSNDSFVVMPSSGLPSGVSASTIARVGQAVVGGAGATCPLVKAGTQGIITFTVTAGVTAVTAAVTGSTFPSGVRVYVYGPANELVTSGNIPGASGSLNVPTLAPGTYLLLVVPGAGGTGNVSIQLLNASPVRGAVAIGGPAVPLANRVAGQQLVWTFQGTAGQQVNLDVTGYSALSGNSTLGLYDQEGHFYGGTWISNPGLLGSAYGPFTLNLTGTYTLLLVPEGPATGSATVQVLPMLPPVSGTVAIGGPSVQLTNTAPAQQLVWTFQGTAGQQVSIELNGYTGLSPNSDFSLRDEQGRSYASTWISNPNLLRNAWGPFTLTMTGTYTLVLAPVGLGTGNATVQLLPTLPSVTGTVTVGGAAVQLTNTAPGQQLVWTFSGTAGQQVYVHLNRYSLLSGSSLLSLYDAQSRSYASTWISNPNLLGNAWGPFTLTMTGTYTLVLAPAGLATGSAAVQLLPTPPPVTGTVTIAGPAVKLTSTAPGQQLKWTFACKAGQGITLAVNSYSGLSRNSSISIYDQLSRRYGSRDLGLLSNGTASTNPLGPYTVNVNGTCTAVLTPQGLGFGSAALQISSAAGGTGSSFVAGTLTAGGSAVTLTSTTAGQALMWTLQGTAGQQISIALDRYSGLKGDSTLSLYDQQGSRYGGDYLQFLSDGTRATARLGPYSLPRTATYTIVVVPSGSGTGNAVVRAMVVPQAVTSALAVNGGAVQLANAAPGQLLVWTFSGTAGQQISVALDRYQGVDGVSSLSLYDQQSLKYGSEYLQFLSNGSAATASLGPYTLPRTGTYKVVLAPSRLASGSAAVRVFSVPQSATGSVTVGGAAVQLASSVARQQLVWTFQGTAGMRIAAAVDRYAGLSGYSTIALYDQYGLKYGSDNIVFLGNGSSATAPLGPFTLPRTGRYTLVLVPASLAPGSAAVRVVNAAPVTGTLTIGGPAVALTSTGPWQTLLWRFSGTQGQRIKVWVPGRSGLGAGSQFFLFDQEGRAYLSKAPLAALSNNSAGAYTLQLTGTYTLALVPADTTAGTAIVQVSP